MPCLPQIIHVDPTGLTIEQLYAAVSNRIADINSNENVLDVRTKAAIREILRTAISEGARHTDITTSDYHGYTSFHIAAIREFIAAELSFPGMKMTIREEEGMEHHTFVVTFGY